MSVEYDIAAQVAKDGLTALKTILSDIIALPMDRRLRHTRDVTECIKAATMVMAEEREQLEFEESNKIAPEDIRAALKEYLASLPANEYESIIAEARGTASKETHA